MGQRTRNRIREHSGDGHQLTQSALNHEGLAVLQKSEDAGKRFWTCVCGWEGWLTTTLNAKE